MKPIILFVIWLKVLVSPVLLRDIPSFVPLCKRDDPEISKCFINSVNTIRPYLVKGIPEMDIPPGEPLHYYNTSTTAGIGQVQLVGKAWNQTVYGLMDFDIKSVELDLENAICKASVFFPKVRFTGMYNFIGKVLLFEIDTIGDFEINTTNVLVNANFVGRFYTKKSKRYVEFQQVDLKYSLGDTKIYFDNIINGNEELSVTVNQAINNNIQILIEDFNPIVEYALSGLIQLYFNNVFRLYPFDTLFPTEG